MSTKSIKLFLSKAKKTNKITRDEASEWFRFLSLHTDLFLKNNWAWYYKKDYWPIKAQKKNAADKHPDFCILHHTSNKNRDYRPAMHRFLQAKKASSNFVISETGNVIFLVPLHNQSYHAVRRAWFPEDFVRKYDIDRGWLDVPGAEIAGNGNLKLFTYEQFLSIICLHRYMASYFPSIKRIFSHRKFSPKSRKNDPGKFMVLPLIEHAVFNDVDLKSKDYWLEDYKKNPVKFMKNSYKIMEEYNVLDKDEWSKERRGIKVTKDML